MTTASKDHIFIHGIEQNSDAWHALRLGRITASNAYTLLTKGVNAATNTVSDNSAGYWAQRGHDLEPVALALYEKARGLAVEKAGFITNDLYPGCGYSPDGLCDRPVEVKCFAAAKHIQCLSEIPMTVYAQVQFGMMIIEWDQADIVFYNPDVLPDLQFKIYTVDRDNRLIERFKRKLEAIHG